jgi:hypothetical protein
MFGLAAATRVEIGLIFPSFLIAQIINRNISSKKTFVQALLATVIGGIVLIINFSVLTYLTPQDINGDLNSIFYASGVKDVYFGGLNIISAVIIKLFYLHGLIIPGAIFAVAFVLFRSSFLDIKIKEPLIILFTFSCILTAAWFFISSGLLRYLLSAIICFSVIFGWILCSFLSSIKLPQKDVLISVCFIFAFGQMIGEASRSAKMLLHGNSESIQMWYQGSSSIQGLYSFRSIRAEKKIMEYIKQKISPNAVITVLGADALEMMFLTDREIRNLATMLPKLRQEDIVYIYVRPTLGHVNHFPKETINWIEKECSIELDEGPYKLYKLTGHVPENPSVINYKLWFENLWKVDPSFTNK